MSFRIFLFVSLICAALFWACEPEIDLEELSNNPGISPGELNFQNFVAIGDEFTAGFHSRELFFSGQFNAYPAIMARQFTLVGGEGFSFPAMYDESGFGNRLALGNREDCREVEELTLIPYNKEFDPRNSENLGPNLYNNMGVPGLKVLEIDNDDYEDDNPYWARMIASEGATYLAHLELTPISSFVLWLGTADVLRWAKNGGQSFGSELSFITPSQFFEDNYRELLELLSTKTNRGLLVTIPKIKDFPFFELIPRDALELTAEQAAQLNVLYAANPFVSFREGKNPFVVSDGLFTRQISNEERILLSLDLDSVKCGGYGSVIPFSDADVLLLDELFELDVAIDNYNRIIRRLGKEFGYPVVDIEDFYKEIRVNGLIWDGARTNYSFVSGGYFSLDGICPTPKGSAFLANELIGTLNRVYNAQIPLANPNDFEGVRLP
ncbi:MAG: hypothetical protein ACPF8V_05475 [Luteibaculum sp.]